MRLELIELLHPPVFKTGAFTNSATLPFIKNKMVGHEGLEPPTNRL